MSNHSKNPELEHGRAPIVALEGVGFRLLEETVKMAHLPAIAAAYTSTFAMWTRYRIPAHKAMRKLPAAHSPSLATGTRTPTKNCPNSAYTALTSSKRIS